MPTPEALSVLRFRGICVAGDRDAFRRRPDVPRHPANILTRPLRSLTVMDAAVLRVRDALLRGTELAVVDARTLEQPAPTPEAPWFFDTTA